MIKRDQIIKTLQELPAETTVDEAIEKLIFLQNVQEGLNQSEAGDVVSMTDAKKKLSKWSQ